MCRVDNQLNGDMQDIARQITALTERTRALIERRRLLCTRCLRRITLNGARTDAETLHCEVSSSEWQQLTHTPTHTLAATSRCNTVISVLLMDLKANVFIALLLSQRCSTFNIYTISLNTTKMYLKSKAILTHRAVHSWRLITLMLHFSSIHTVMRPRSMK